MIILIMKSKLNYKKIAILLRKRGLSYNEISKEIPIAKSTLSVWLKTVQLSKKHQDRLYSKRIHYLTLGSQSQKERRLRQVEIITNTAKGEISVPISDDAYRLFGAALYWAEGTKGGSLVFTNSDPHLILFMTKWLQKVFAISPDFLKASLNIYSQQNENLIKYFWSDLTGIPIGNFNRTFIKPKNKNFKKNNLYYGTIKIYVPKSTDLQIRVFGWVKKVLDNISPTPHLIQKKWERLKKVERPVNLK